MTVLIPAAGRDYNAARLAKGDFLYGLDFRISGIHRDSLMYDGQLCSIRDFKPGETVEIRYKDLTRLVLVTVPDLEEEN